MIPYSTIFPNENSPDSLHHLMFMNALEKQLDPDQSKQWLPLAKSMNIVGTYAQTELGHGKCILFTCQLFHSFEVFDPSFSCAKD